MFNAHSVVNKVLELHQYLYCEIYDMLFITETWLTTEISLGLLDLQFHYHILRKDRISVGGGAAAFVKRYLLVSEVIIDNTFAEKNGKSCTSLLPWR